jgi:iron complex transport system substrate-binding protein
MRRSPLFVAVGALAAIMSLVAASCGDDDTAATTGTAPPEQQVGPQRIVSLSPSLTETLFAIGAGDRVVAADEYSNHPDDAPTTELSGFTPNVEAIAEYEPDLVVMSDDIDGIAAKLESLGIETLVLPAPADIDGAYSQIEQVGTATGNVGDAAEVVLEMKTRIDAAVEKAPKPSEPLTYYHELDSMLFTVTSKSFVGEVYSLFGLENVADPADSAGTGYPQLSAEFLVEANPDLVFLADTKCCSENAQTFGARPGFAALDAVDNDTVIALDDDIASRWGPRIADFAEAIGAALEKLPEPVKAR